MLQNNLYTVIASSDLEEGFMFRIHLEEESPIFKAHFPHHPITPGVCIMQIAKELFEAKMDIQVEITKIRNIKFMQVMTPSADRDYTYHFYRISAEGNAYQMHVIITSGETTYSKLLFTCQKTA